MSQDDIDKVLDPEKLKFGMSPRERKDLEAELKRKKKKKSKPDIH